MSAWNHWISPSLHISVPIRDSPLENFAQCEIGPHQFLCQIGKRYRKLYWLSFNKTIPDCENESNFYEETKFLIDGSHSDSYDYLMIGAKPSYKVRASY